MSAHEQYLLVFSQFYWRISVVLLVRRRLGEREREREMACEAIILHGAMIVILYLIL